MNRSISTPIIHTYHNVCKVEIVTPDLTTAYVCSTSIWVSARVMDYFCDAVAKFRYSTQNSRKSELSLLHCNVKSVNSRGYETL